MSNERINDYDYEETEKTTIPNAHNTNRIDSLYRCLPVPSLFFALLALVMSIIAIIITKQSQQFAQTSCEFGPITCHDQQNYFNDYVPSKVLVIMAHPDDIEATCAGTLAKWIKEAQTQVAYVLLTSGDKGSSNISQTAQQIIQIRREEQRNAAKEIGVQAVHFLDFMDGVCFLLVYNNYFQYVSNTDEARKNVTYYIRKYQPDLIITWNPMRHLHLYSHGFEHDDHQTTGAIVLSSSYPTSGNVHYYPELQLPVFKVKQIYLVSFFKEAKSPTQAHVVIPLTMQQVESKARALLQHKSQYKDAAGLTNGVFELASYLGEASSTIYAEWFERILIQP